LALLVKKDPMDGIGKEGKNAIALTHTYYGTLGTLTLNYIIIIYIKDANVWQGYQFKDAKDAKFCDGMVALFTPPHAGAGSHGRIALDRYHNILYVADSNISVA